jgi:dynactin 1
LTSQCCTVSDDPTEGKAAEDGPAKDSLAYIQLEKQNERLKEALIKYACPLSYVSYLLSSVRLRDMTQETDQEQRRRIAEMEKDVANFEDLQGKFYIIYKIFH